ncbi:hypothetical protein VTO42DRAFT_7311 [Malbranchea cinnamomea]
MVAQLPPGFVALDTAKSRIFGNYDVMGIAVDVLPPRQSGGTSFSSTFTIKDHDFSSEWWNGLKVRCFKDKKSDLPCPDVGDVVLLRKIKIRDFNGAVIGFSSQKDSLVWTIFKPNAQDPIGYSIINQSIPPSSAEKQYAFFLLKHGNCPPSTPTPAVSHTPASAESTALGSTSSIPPGGPLRKFTLLKDLEYGKFADIVGQVVKVFQSSYDSVTLYVTDYTENKDLFKYAMEEETEEGRDGDEFNYIPRRAKRPWPGPFGRMTLQVTLFEPHARYARDHVKENTFVVLRNVRIKMGRTTGFMEGALHTDRIYPKKVTISVIDDNDPNDYVREVLRRKLEYWKKAKASIRRSEGGSKRQLSDNETNNSKQSKKKRQKEKKKQLQKKDDPEQPKPVTFGVKRDELNPHIRSSHPAVPCRSIRDILENESHRNSAPGQVEYILPFQNFRYRATVRVVDFFPPKLEDFSVKYDVDRAMLGDEESVVSDDSNSDAEYGRRKWEWRFCLLVEDGGRGVRYNPGEPRPRMKLFVADADAVFLLGMDAEDLRANPQALAVLREKLFILWGNLEECKNENPNFDPDAMQSIVSAKPFTCCIKEYGVRAESTSDNEDQEEKEEPRNPFGWERRFRMFGTTIY